MAPVVAIVGILIALSSLIGTSSPDALRRLSSWLLRSNRSFYVATAIRIVLGVILVLAAGDCLYPRAVRVLGVFTVVAGISIPAIGFERLRRMMAWFTANPGWFIRGWSLAGLVFGAFLIYAAVAPFSP